MTFTGTVHGPDDQPVAGAAVSVGEYDLGSRDPRQREATTEAAGAVTLTLNLVEGMPSAAFATYKEGFALGLIRAEAGQPVALALGLEGEPVVVEAVTPEGEPVTGATVRVQSMAYGTAEGRSRGYRGDIAALCATKDAEGRHVLRHVPPDATVYAEVTAPGRTSNGRLDPSWPDEEAAKPLRVVMAPEAVITGRVTHDRQPVAPARPLAGPCPLTGAMATTGEDGA